MTGAVTLLACLAFGIRNTAKVSFASTQHPHFRGHADKANSQPYQLRQTRTCSSVHQLPGTGIAARSNAVQRIRKGMLGTDTVVHAGRQRIQRDPTHQAPNPRLRSSRQPSRPARLDLRETPRLDGRVPLDRRRDPDLGLDLPVLDRRAGSQHEDLLRSGARDRFRPRQARGVRPARQARTRVLPQGSRHPSEELGPDAGAGGVREPASGWWAFCCS